MPENIRQTEFNKNVIQVYTEEPNFTGYKGFDFTAIDELETLVRSGLIPKTEDLKSILETGQLSVNQMDLHYLTDHVSISGYGLELISGINEALTSSGININQLDLNYLSDNVSISGLALNYLSVLPSVTVTGENIPSGLTVYQANLDKDYDNVSVFVSGNALNYLSGIASEGVALKGINTVNVNVTGGNLNVINEVEIKNQDNNPIPIIQEKSSSISNYNLSGSNGTILMTNLNRKELYIQNLSTGNLYVKYGLNASSSSFNFVLAANTAEDAGDGGSVSDQGYVGLVSVSGANPRYINWERV